ncbi:MAG: 16S rRNA (uracil(1498)-N(3))-methyltransferase [Candidatus Omnitrophota bacterium]
MNLLLLQEEDFISDRCVKIGGRRLEHLRHILSIRPGDSVRAGRVNGLCGEARVLEISASEIILEVSLSTRPPEKHDIDVILALPRPPVAQRLLRHLAAFGIRRIIFLQTGRVQKSYWQSPVLQEEAVRKQLVLGLEQAQDTVLPEVEYARNFSVFMKKRLPEISEGRRCLLSHSEGASSCPCAVSAPVTTAFGPEGGFLADEIEEFRDVGWETVHLGSRVLRVETAVQAVLGRLADIG